MAVYTLYQLAQSVRRSLSQTFSGEYWIKAETSDVRTRRPGAHLYLELIEKEEESQNLLAKARATIWAARCPAIIDRFERETGQPFASGLQILVKVSVRYHELYGLSLDILDIDPVFTLGGLAERRRKIIAQLRKEGLLDRNKRHPLPALIRHIAVISSGTAAGWGDFRTHLLHNPHGFPFLAQLFQATMQGSGAERSIVAALERVERSGIPFDAVVIIRGGGAVSDLSCFDSYELALRVAMFPLPILSGIGHERDESIVDLVAHTAFKTPTAVADFLVSHRLEARTLLSERSIALERSIRRMLEAEHHRLVERSQQLPALVRRTTREHSELIHYYRTQLMKGCLRFIQYEQTFLTQAQHLATSRLTPALVSAHEQLHFWQKRLPEVVQRSLRLHREQLDGLSRQIDLLSPKKTLERGYSIILKEGKALTGQISVGDHLTVLTAQQQFRTTVDQVAKPGEKLLTKEAN